MRQVRVLETVTETSLGPRSSFVVEERRWWGWKDISTIGGWRLGSREQADEVLRRRCIPDRVVIHAVTCGGCDRPMPEHDRLMRCPQLGRTLGVQDEEAA